MKEKRIKYQKFSVCLSILMLLTIFISISNTKIFASAENFTNDSGSDLFNDKVDLEYDIARVSEELFGDKSIQKSDYL